MAHGQGRGDAEDGEGALGEGLDEAPGGDAGEADEEQEQARGGDAGAQPVELQLLSGLLDGRQLEGQQQHQGEVHGQGAEGHAETANCMTMPRNSGRKADSPEAAPDAAEGQHAVLAMVDERNEAEHRGDHEAGAEADKDAAAPDEDRHVRRQRHDQLARRRTGPRRGGSWCASR